ncbi:MAG: hypothetical protein IT258_20150 [Saprospiraceae bacterium]|nr:hypothetical protein [Saprospiraceae bacterium]
MKYTVLYFSLLCLVGCTPVLKMLYGIKPPKIENKETLTEYMVKLKMEQQNVYALTFDEFKPSLKHIKNSVPDVLIFNSQGEYIPYGDEYACNAHAFDFIEKLNRNSVYTTSDKLDMATISKGLCNLDGGMVEEPISKNIDFYVFIYWAKWAGKLNKDHVLVWEKQAIENRNANIKVITVNVDSQAFWGSGNLKKLGF